MKNTISSLVAAAALFVGLKAVGEEACITNIYVQFTHDVCVSQTCPGTVTWWSPITINSNYNCTFYISLGSSTNSGCSGAHAGDIQVDVGQGCCSANSVTIGYLHYWNCSSGSEQTPIALTVPGGWRVVDFIIYDTGTGVNCDCHLAVNICYDTRCNNGGSPVRRAELSPNGPATTSDEEDFLQEVERALGLDRPRARQYMRDGVME